MKIDEETGQSLKNEAKPTSIDLPASGSSTGAAKGSPAAPKTRFSSSVAKILICSSEAAPRPVWLVASRNAFGSRWI